MPTKHAIAPSDDVILSAKRAVNPRLLELLRFQCRYGVQICPSRSFRRDFALGLSTVLVNERALFARKKLSLPFSDLRVSATKSCYSLWYGHSRHAGLAAIAKRFGFRETTKWPNSYRWRTEVKSVWKTDDPILLIKTARDVLSATESELPDDYLAGAEKFDSKLAEIHPTCDYVLAKLFDLHPNWIDESSNPFQRIRIALKYLTLDIKYWWVDDRDEVQTSYPRLTFLTHEARDKSSGETPKLCPPSDRFLEEVAVVGIRTEMHWPTGRKVASFPWYGHTETTLIPLVTEIGKRVTRLGSKAIVVADRNSKASG